MAARISLHLRFSILKELSQADGDLLSLRDIATKLGVSLSAVQRWKDRKDMYDLPRNPDGQQGLSDFEKQVFIEMATISRYPWRYLCEYLAPVWPSLPTQEKKEQRREDLQLSAADRKPVKVWSEATLRRLMQEHPDDALRLPVNDRTVAHNRPEAKVGIVVVHSVFIEWKEQDKRVKGDLLVLMDRSSGLLYAKAYSGRVGVRSVALCIGKMDQMIPFGIDGLQFIVRGDAGLSDSTKAWKKSILGLVLNSPINPENEDEFVTVVKNKLQDEMTTSSNSADEELDIEISHDDQLTYDQQRVMIPGEFSTKKSLNLYVAELVNKINTTVRGYCFYRDLITVTPVDRLMHDKLMFGGRKRVRSRVGSLNRARCIKVGKKVKFGPRKTRY